MFGDFCEHYPVIKTTVEEAFPTSPPERKRMIFIGENIRGGGVAGKGLCPVTNRPPCRHGV
jgi:hypothetical protein